MRKHFGVYRRPIQVGRTLTPEHNSWRNSRRWASWTDLRIIERHVRTSETKRRRFVNHALYNYFATNCWELLSETARRGKATGKPLSNDRLCHYRRKLSASYYSESYRYCTGCIRELRIRPVNVAHTKGGFPVMHDTNDIMHIASIIATSVYAVHVRAKTHM